MQHPHHPPALEEPVLVLEDVVRELWPCLDTQAIRAMRLCCTPLRDAVDAHISGLVGPINDDAPVLSAAACARLNGVHTMTLRSMACLRGMQLVAPHAQPDPFPRLTSLRMLIDERGAPAIEAAADYEAITKIAPWLTQLSLRLPHSAAALPQQMASLLSACSKLEDLTLHAYDEAVPTYMPPVSNLVHVDALAAGIQLLHLRLPCCSSLLNLAPLRGLVNLQSLDISQCRKVSDLAPLGALVNLQSQEISFSDVSDLAPLGALVSLRSLKLKVCHKLSDLAPLGALVNLQSLYICNCRQLSDLAPLGSLVNLQSLNISACNNVYDLAPLGSLVNLQSLGMGFCKKVTDLAPLRALPNLQKLVVSKKYEDKVAPLQNRVGCGALQVVYLG
ncbi:hypothetical protein FOA52_011036 [Chlamydomonas sp. UWO 241]|nr:hypothetical protein FOA52_011036 [Chlamydomonas sp. UWO 241]